MPRPNDDMEQRRRRRAARNKKKRQEQERFRRKLILAAVVFVACALLVAYLTAGTGRESTDPTGTEPTVPVFTPPTEERATLPPETPTTTIHILAGGDLNVTDKVVASGATNFGEGYYDYTGVFLDVAPLLSAADLTLLNFEGNLVGPPYGTQTASAPQQLVEALSQAGVDILQMANSYAIHNGTIGLSQTLANIRSAGIEPVGAFSNPGEFNEARGYTICEIRGVKVAIVAFTKGMNSLGLPAGNETLVNKLFLDYDTNYQKIDSNGIRAILKDVRSENPDVIIAMLHWGAEYNDTVFKSQQTIASLMIENGVDIILGTHSHMVHPIEFNQEQNTLVAYSLGDFFGDAAKNGTQYSILLDIQITRDNELGTTKIDSFSVTPIYTISETESNGQRRVVRIQEAVAAYEINFVDKVTKEAYDSMINALGRIEVRVDPEKFWEDD